MLVFAWGCAILDPKNGKPNLCVGYIVKKFGRSLLVAGMLVWLAFAGSVQAQRASSKLPTQDSSLNCDISLRAEVQPQAMVALTLTGGCLPHEKILLRHSGLMFSLKTDANGITKIIVPALAEKAIFIVTYDNGDGALTMVDVPDMARYQRVVLQWQGAKGLQLHAYQDGAKYGGQGHIWFENSAFDANNSDAGIEFFILLGDAELQDGFHAEVASFLVQKAGDASAVSLNIAAEITTDNCGRNVAVEIFLRNRDTGSDSKLGGGLDNRGLTLFVPECHMAGNFIVMKNVIENLNLSLGK